MLRNMLLSLLLSTQVLSQSDTHEFKTKSGFEATASPRRLFDVLGAFPPPGNMEFQKVPLTLTAK